MKKLLLPILLLTVCSLLIACGDSNSLDTIYTITFDLNEGTGDVPPPQEVKHGGLLPDISDYQAPTRGHFYFAGYYDEQIEGEKYYTKDMQPAKEEWDKKEDATLYAQWTTIPIVEIVFHSNYENVGMKTQDVQENTSVSLEPNTFTRTGYEFAGWSLSSTATVGDIANEANYQVGTSRVDLYAVWTANSYTITFNANEGVGGQTEIVTATFGQPMPTITEAPTRTGYMFTGYFDDETEGEKYYNADLTSARNWDKASSAILYAQWVEHYELGDTGPGGGIIFYISEAGFEVTGYGTAHYLEAAPADMATTLAWGGTGITISGTGDEIGRGRDNTDRILDAVPAAPAALACRNYTGGGLTDWFFPSLDELYQLYSQMNLVDGFSSDWYWSSSEWKGSGGAWVQDFGDGNQHGDFKDDTNRVRAIRAF